MLSKGSNPNKYRRIFDMKTYKDEEYQEAYTLLNLLQDLFNRINILIEYITTVFFPNFPKD